ncbi:MAG: hypothetical protein LBC40_04285 [Dysgonamonadaceae bacterium]|jgi:hypothetical protein|nr:hypothetical protein [Dysgonamonadaceae bacterium]
MTTIAITPKSKKEQTFLVDLFKRMNIRIDLFPTEELEDAGLLNLMKDADRNDVATEEEIMKLLQ